MKVGLIAIFNNLLVFLQFGQNIVGFVEFGALKLKK